MRNLFKNPVLGDIVMIIVIGFILFFACYQILNSNVNNSNSTTKQKHFSEDSSFILKFDSLINILPNTITSKMDSFINMASNEVDLYAEYLEELKSKKVNPIISKNDIHKIIKEEIEPIKNQNIELSKEIKQIKTEKIFKTFGLSISTILVISGILIMIFLHKKRKWFQIGAIISIAGLSINLFTFNLISIEKGDRNKNEITYEFFLKPERSGLKINTICNIGPFKTCDVNFDENKFKPKIEKFVRNNGEKIKLLYIIGGADRRDIFLNGNSKYTSNFHLATARAKKVDSLFQTIEKKDSFEVVILAKGAEEYGHDTSKYAFDRNVQIIAIMED